MYDYESVHISTQSIYFSGSRIQLAHPLQSVDWLGIGQYHFLSTAVRKVESASNVIC